MSTETNPLVRANGGKRGLGSRLSIEPATIVWVLLIGVLLFLVALPMAKLIIVSFTTRSGAFTFANYITAYGRARYVDALVN